MLEINQYIDSKYLPSKELTHAEFEKKYKPIIEILNSDLAKGILTKEEYKKQLMFQVPARGIYIEDYPELKLDLKAGSHYYYEKLQQAQKDKKEKGTSGSKAMDKQLEQMEAGEPMPFDHDWSEIENLDEATKLLVQRQVEHQLTEVAEQIKKSQGKVPGEIQEILDRMIPEPPKFNWKAYLRRFAGNSTRTYSKSSRSKFNKRFVASPGLKIKEKKHILFGVDVSASVVTKELQECFNEIDHIHKQGVDITVVQFDTAISKIEKYKKNMDIHIHGRGGTMFEPIIAYANEQRNKYTALIIFTDGEASAPNDSCRLKTLWVHSSISKINDSLKGYKIKLN